MDQFVEISYTPDFSRLAIQVDVTSRPDIVRLVANKSGMAHLAELVADFLTYLVPEDLVYELTEENSLVSGSPSLALVFDPALDRLEPESTS
jgi:hypothetical protein